MSIHSSPITIQRSNQSENSAIQTGLEKIRISQKEQDEFDSINSDDQKKTSDTNNNNIDTKYKNYVTTTNTNNSTIDYNTNDSVVDDDDSVIVTKVITDDTMSSSPSSYTSSKGLPSVSYTNSEIDRKLPKKLSAINNGTAKSNSNELANDSGQNNDRVSNIQNRFNNIDKDERVVDSGHMHNGDKDNGDNNNDADEGDELLNIRYIVNCSTEMIIKMLTSLLNKIIHSNDKLSNMNPLQPIKGDYNSSSRDYYNSCISAIMSFKGKHVPPIELEQYFYRIQKYCPTTNDIFLSLLIYFDRISKKCNNLAQYMTLSNKGNDTERYVNEIPRNNVNEGKIYQSDSFDNKVNENDNEENDTQLFAMDSYNIHRLIITAIAVSTKFSSDYFYSNARYSKVGGISLREMNYLELQFLILCDFNLLITVEEYERYANLLYRFCSNQDLV